MSTADCFYATLNVAKNATTEEIKKAYKKLAVRWHPDKNPDNQEEASERFKRIGEAYETLSDPELRRQYDNGGVNGFNFDSANFRSAPRNNFSRGFSDKRAFDIFNAFFADMEDFHQRAFASHRSAFGGGGDYENRHQDSSNRRDDRRSSRKNGNGMRDPFANMHSSLFDDDFFGDDPFMRSGFGGGAFGGGFGGGLLGGNLHDMFGGGFGGGGGNVSMTSSSFSSSTIMGGGRGGGKSVSTSTYIGPDGRKVTKRETTIIHPDGRTETTTDESVEDGHGNRLAYDDGKSSSSSNNRRLHIDSGQSTVPQRGSSRLDYGASAPTHTYGQSATAAPYGSHRSSYAPSSSSSGNSRRK